MIVPDPLDDSGPGRDPIRPDLRLDETVAPPPGEAGPTRLDALEATIGPVPRVDHRDPNEASEPAVGPTARILGEAR